MTVENGCTQAEADAAAELLRGRALVVYGPRATKSEMEERADFLVDYAREHGPVTVRGLYYQAEVAQLPGIDKAEQSYRKVQRQVLNLRRQGRIPYTDIADATRWMRKPRSYSSLEEALDLSARTYRRSLWDDEPEYVEVWCEKDAMAGVLFDVTSKYDVPLMVARGFVSETFAYEAIAQRGEDDRPYRVYYLGDLDRSGRDAARTLEEKLTRFGAEAGIRVWFEQIAVTEEQVEELNLPTRSPKRESAADRKWPLDYACELDAIPPDKLRELVEDVITLHIEQRELDVLRAVEESERLLLKTLARKVKAKLPTE
jgi:hypothetical protein